MIAASKGVEVGEPQISFAPSWNSTGSCLAFAGAEEEHWGWEATACHIYPDLISVGENTQNSGERCVEFDQYMNI